MDQSKILVIGKNGQLGKALFDVYPAAIYVSRKELDISDTSSINSFDYQGIEIIINAAAYTNVDGAETEQGRIDAWKTNSTGPAELAKVCLKKDITLFHVSSEYVFDGTKSPHTEDEDLSPLGVYGQTKAAGDIAVEINPKHYIFRTSWVVGDGKNFIKTMLMLGEKGINPSVVSDQLGRLTFATELARAISFIIENRSDYGLYNISNEGHIVSWADIAKEVFSLAGYKNTVTYVTTNEYFKDKEFISPRPLNSSLDLNKLSNIGFKPMDWRDNLSKYIAKELSK